MTSRTCHKPELAEGSADFQVGNYLIIMTIAPLTPAAKTWIEENTEPWQWQSDRLCVENALGTDILRRISLAGLSFEGTPIEIPDDLGAGERLLQERNWVRVMQQNMPPDIPRRAEAVAIIEQFLRGVGFPIQ